MQIHSTLQRDSIGGRRNVYSRSQKGERTPGVRNTFTKHGINNTTQFLATRKREKAGAQELTSTEDRMRLTRRHENTPEEGISHSRRICAPANIGCWHTQFNTATFSTINVRSRQFQFYLQSSQSLLQKYTNGLY
ncbi:hypothetical protein DMENIID0001_092670 [Sergentomyia squamirostris]